MFAIRTKSGGQVLVLEDAKPSDAYVARVAAAYWLQASALEVADKVDPAALPKVTQAELEATVKGTPYEKPSTPEDEIAALKTRIEALEKA